MVANAIPFARSQFLGIYDVLFAGNQSLTMSIHVLLTGTMTPFATDGKFLEGLGGVVAIGVVIKKVNLASMTRETGFG